VSFKPRLEVISIQIEFFRFPIHHLTKVCEPVIHAICMDLRLDQSSCIHLSIEPLLIALGCLDHELFKFQNRFSTLGHYENELIPPHPRRVAPPIYRVSELRDRHWKGITNT